MWRLSISKGITLGLLILFVSLFSVVACGGGGEEPAATEKKDKKEKPAKKRRGAAGPEEAAGEATDFLTGMGIKSKEWHYDPTGKWDPFNVPEQPPPTDIGTRYDLDQMTLYGIIRGSGMDAAYIRMPDGSDRIVRIGDILGKHGGEVKEIGKDYLIVEERYMNPDPEHLNETFIIEKELRLAEGKGKNK